MTAVSTVWHECDVSRSIPNSGVYNLHIAYVTCAQILSEHLRNIWICFIDNYSRIWITHLKPYSTQANIPTTVHNAHSTAHSCHIIMSAHEYVIILLAKGHHVDIADPTKWEAKPPRFFRPSPVGMPMKAGEDQRAGLARDH